MSEENKMVIEPEPSLIGWIGNSIILMTAALLAFHMTKTGSLKVHPVAAAVISIGLILVDMAFSITSIIPYNTRWENIKHYQTDPHEKRYRVMYTTIIAIFILVQLLICYYIVVDSIILTRKMPKSKRYKYFEVFA